MSSRNATSVAPRCLRGLASLGRIGRDFSVKVDITPPQVGVFGPLGPTIVGRASRRTYESQGVVGFRG